MRAVVELAVIRQAHGKEADPEFPGRPFIVDLQSLKPSFIHARLTARLEAAPFQNGAVDRVFHQTANLV